MGANTTDPRAGRTPNASLVGSVTPTRRKAHRSAGKGDATRDRIIRDAAQCVLDEGFAAASASRIAQRSGVTWGVIQYHFGDRASLFSAVVEAGFEEFPSIVRAAPPTDGDAATQVRSIVDVGWRAFSTPLGRASIEILVNTRASRANDPAHARHLLDMARGLHKVLDESFATLGADLPPALRNVVWATLRGFVLALMMSPSDFDFERERTLLVDVIATYVQDHDRHDLHDLHDQHDQGELP